MVDIEGVELDSTDIDLLKHPLIGGVILFSRNYRDPEQLISLTKQIHEIKTPNLLIAVDQEGGRVQRLRNGFTEIPAAATIGSVYDENKQKALALAERCGWLLAVELRAVGIDFSFAPVLDLFTEKSTVINDRAFHKDPAAIVDIAGSFVAGLKRGGVAAIGKHFPGHGSVEADSHLELPVDERSYYDISHLDLIPFRRLAEKLQGVMPAHVLFPQVDRVPAGFSRVWIQQILREEFNFQGVVFSDDLTMKGALAAGDIIERATAAKNAGCDMILICNDRVSVNQLVAGWHPESDPLGQVRLMRLHGKAPILERGDFATNAEWLAIHEELMNLTPMPSLDLGDDAPA